MLSLVKNIVSKIDEDSEKKNVRRRSIIDKFEEQIDKNKNESKISEEELSSLNIIADQFAEKVLDIARKLSIDCSARVINFYTKSGTEVKVKITKEKENSHFSFEKFADYIENQASSLINTNQFIFECKNFDEIGEKIEIYIVKI